MNLNSLLCLTCAECARRIPAELTSMTIDDCGYVLFGCCPCGMSTADHSFSRLPNAILEFVIHGPPPDEMTATGAVSLAGEVAASSSFVSEASI